MIKSTFFIGALVGAFVFPAFADLTIPPGPNSPPKDLNRAQGGILGLDSWTVHGTFAHACYVFPNYVVWAEETMNADQGSFRVEPIKSDLDGNSLCEKGPETND